MTQERLLLEDVIIPLFSVSRFSWEIFVDLYLVEDVLKSSTDL